MIPPNVSVFSHVVLARTRLTPPPIPPRNQPINQFNLEGERQSIHCFHSPPDPRRHAASTPSHLHGARAAVRRLSSSRGGNAGHRVRTALRVRRRPAAKEGAYFLHESKTAVGSLAEKLPDPLQRPAGLGATLPRRAPRDPPPLRAHQGDAAPGPTLPPRVLPLGDTTRRAQPAPFLRLASAGHLRP
ncbi:hypothetical protein PAHAL_5G078400 [Panicum hallii]|uniref:Uncharacterized protein n=1 Tax=Panicum hallii TaxID=206008 RepID=A0A2S3HPQ0_9POAL|nr:hypothetical protein PAHAL_5G078400 [Panicum hallii]